MSTDTLTLGGLAPGSFLLPERTGIIEFVENNIRIPIGKSSTPGPVRFGARPYQVPILQALEADVESVTVVMFSQGGKTLIQICALAHWCLNDPGDVLFVNPQELTKDAFIEDKLEPMVKASPKWEASLVGGKRSITYHKMRCARATVHFVIATSDAQLASRSVRYRLDDEVDKYPAKGQKEGGPLDQARKRQRTYKGRGRMALDVSTPTEPKGPIWRNLKNSDWRVWEVPCLSCGEFHEWRMAQLVFPDRLEGDGQKESCHAWATRIENGETEGVAWACPSCGAMTRGDRQKALMNKGGRFRVTQPDIKRHIGFHVNAFASPDVSWDELAVEFLKARHEEHFGNYEPMRVFHNHELAMPYVPPTASVAEEAITQRTLDIAPGIVPRGFEIVTIGVDVQDNRIYWMACAWKTEPLACHVMDWGMVMGTPMEALRAAREAIIGKRWQAEDARQLVARGTGIDSGDGDHRTIVYGFCARIQDVYPVKGNNTALAGGSIVKLNEDDKQDHGGKLTTVCPRASQDALMSFLKQDPVRVAGEAMGITFSRKALEDEDFQQQMVSEERGQDGNYAIREDYSANHFRDTWRYSAAMAARKKVFRGRGQKQRNKTPRKISIPGRFG